MARIAFALLQHERRRFNLDTEPLMTKTTPHILRFILAAVLAFSMVPAAAFAAPMEEAEKAGVEQRETSAAAAQEGEQGSGSAAAEQESDQDNISSDSLVPDSADVADAAEAAALEEAANEAEFETYATGELALNVTTSELKCGTITFTLDAVNGSDKCVFRCGQVMRWTDGQWTICFDTGRTNDPLNQFTESNVFTRDFVSPGDYWITFNVMDKGVTPVDSARNSYHFTIKDDDPAHPSVETKAKQVYNQMVSEGITGEYERALWLHDYLIDTADYDHSYRYSCADGVLLRKTGTCESYHQAYMMLLKLAGIACGRAEDTEVDMHVWTLVRINGVWCHVDTTWDDNTNTLPGTQQDTRRYLFGVDDNIIKLVHEGYKGSGADSLEYSYFIKSGKIEQFSKPLHAQIQSYLDARNTSFSLTVPYASWPEGYKNIIYNIVAYDLKTASWSVEGKPISLSASYANNKLTFTAAFSIEIIAQPSANEMTVGLTARGGVASLSSTANVRFATWSVKGGQDDIRWYQATRSQNGEWRTTVDIRNHRTAGEYLVHVYAVANGRDAFVGATSFTIAQPTATLEILSQTDAQLKSGLFTIKMSNVKSPSGVQPTSVRFPTWSDKDGQNDIVWYNAQAGANGTWTVTAPCVGANREPGLYLVHAYATTGNGIDTLFATTSATTKMSPASLTVSLSQDETYADITAVGGMFNAASSVQFPTWSAKGGQDDIRWYQASRTQKDGVLAWTARVWIRDHRTSGSYAVHAYASIAGATKMLGSTSFTIAQPTATLEILSQTDAQLKSGLFTIKMSNVKSPSGVQPTSVRFPTWSDKDGQNDIVWYNAQAGANGTWTVTAPCVGANREPGLYLVHAYATTGNGIDTLFATTAKQVELAKPTIEASVGSDGRTVTVKATGGYFALASSVQFPTWSSANGQDDIVWYPGSRIQDGYQVTFDAARHVPSNEILIHSYATIAGQMRFAGAISFDATA